MKPFKDPKEEYLSRKDLGLTEAIPPPKPQYPTTEKKSHFDKFMDTAIEAKGPEIVDRFLNIFETIAGNVATKKKENEEGRPHEKEEGKGPTSEKPLYIR